MSDEFINSDLIDRYLKNQMEDSERLNFEEKMASDPELANEVSLQKSILNGIDFHFDQELKQKLQKEEAQFEGPAENGKKINLWIGLAIAAVVVIAFFAYILAGSQQPAYDELYYSHYSPYPNITDPIARDDINDAQSPMQLYESGDFQNAAGLLAEQLAQNPDDPQIKFYYAQAILANDEFNEAYEIFETLASDTTHAFTGPALWYQSLIDIKENRIDRAKSILQQLIKYHRDYTKRGNDLLSALENQ